jgi:hypothetical protein
MQDIRKSLQKILKVTGIFRLEKKKWPLHAAELQSFALELGRSLDLTQFHRCRFVVKSNQELVLDFCLSPSEEGWAPRGTMEMRIPVQEGEDTLPLQMEIKNLEPQKVESRSYCFVNENGLSANGTQPKNMEPVKLSA